MRVGVTGSNGFIGAALVAALVDRGDQVVRFVRAATGSESGTIRWDPGRHLIDEGDWRREGHFSAVVHLAGAGIGDRRWSGGRKQEILASRVSSTRLLVNALREVPGGVPFLASGSAIGYYGSRGDELLDERSAAGDDFLARVCHEWEDEAAALRTSGAGVAALRTGVVMSATGGALAKQLPLFRSGLGGRLGSGVQWLSPIFVVDRLLDGPVNLVAPCALTNRDFTAALARLIHRPARLAVPAVALRWALGAELADAAVLASQRVTPAVLREAGFVFRHPDIQTILRFALAHRA
jgi:uncharacterized protein (TIGR01777 family)